MITQDRRGGPLAVAFYMHDFAGGGVERMRLVLLEALAGHGVRASVIASDAAGPLEVDIPPDTQIVNLHAPRTISGLLPLVKILRRGEFDVVVSNLDHNNIVLLLARLLAGSSTRVVIAQHNALSMEARSGWRYRLVPLFYRMLWRYADAVLAVSDGVADDLARTASIGRKFIRVIHNPVVGSDFCARTHARLLHPWFSERQIPVFVCAGRLTAQKDPAILLEAMAKILRSRPARLIFVGTGELQPMLVARAKALGIEDWVYFAGYQPNPLPWIRGARALVSASRFEGFGNVLVEALACGTQVIATDCPYGPAEILDGGNFGTLVPVGDADAMASAMTALRPREEGEVQRCARGALFSVEACTGKHLALFAELMRPGPGRVRRLFGLPVTALDTEQCAARVLEPARGGGVRLLTTANIDHLRLLRRPAFAEAYASAALVCIDGFPLALYGWVRLMRRCRRVTGCDLFHRLAHHPALATHRLFLVLDSTATAAAARRWLQDRGLADTGKVEVAVPGLLHEEAEQASLAGRIALHGTSLLVMGLGAPVSEIFVHAQRQRLSPCWALCVGQAVRVELGLARRAPAGWRRFGLEWAWRLAHEPRRLGPRYLLAALWFPVAVLRDLLSVAVVPSGR